MSRRKRRRTSVGNHQGWGLRLVCIAGGLLLVAGIAGYFGLRAYLHSESFRRFLSAEASEALDVPGRFDSFEWDGLRFRSGGFSGREGRTIEAVHADGLQTEINPAALSRGVWQLRGNRVKQLALRIDTTAPPEPEVAPKLQHERKAAKQQKPRWLPSEVEVHDLEIERLTFEALTKDGLFAANDLQVKLKHADARGAYNVDVSGGPLVLPFQRVPRIALDRLRLRYQDGQVFVNELKASAWRHGTFTGEGEWDHGAYNLAGQFGGVEAQELLSPSWAKRVRGGLSGTYEVNRPKDLPPVCNGTLQLDDGVLTALPVLDTLAAYADTSRFRVLALSEAKTRWRWQPGGFELNQLVLASSGLMRLEGDLKVTGKRLDGRFLLGIAPGTLAMIPGAETRVFVPGERGLLWAPIRVTGTTDDPREDLSERLIIAAGMRIFETLPQSGEKVLKFTGDALGKSPDEVIETSAKALEKGARAVQDATEVAREVGGILDGLFGKERKKPLPPEHPEPPSDR